MPVETQLVGFTHFSKELGTSWSQTRYDHKMSQWVDERPLAHIVTYIFFIKKHHLTIILMHIGDLKINTKTAEKYLGVMIDSKMRFGKHIRRTTDKAAKGVASLRLMANVSGLRSRWGRLLMSSVKYVLLYGAEVWTHSLNKSCYRKESASATSGLSPSILWQISDIWFTARNSRQKEE